MRVIILGLSAFLGANLVFSRFEKLARGSIAKGVMDGLYDLGGQLERSREGALADVPREVRTRIRREIDSQLGAAGINRSQVRRVVVALRDVRSERGTVAALRRLA